MKILLFVENVARGGVDTFIQTLITNWPKNDDEFNIIVNYNHPGISTLKKINYSKLNVIEYKGVFVSDLVRYEENSLLRKIIFKFVAYICFLYHLLRTKKIIKQIDYDIMMVINGGYPGGDSCRAAAIVGKNVIHNIHNFAAKIPTPFYLIEKIIDRLVSNNTDYLISVSGICLKSVKERISGKQELYIHNGVKKPLEILKSNDTKEKIQVSIVGSFSERKGQIEFLDVIKLVINEYERVVFKFYGENETKDSGYLSKFTNLVAQKNLQDFVIINGFCTQEEIYSQTDVLCVPSLFSESFGLVCIEAMGRGIPVIVNNVGGLPEVVNNGFDGLVVNKGTNEDFSNKILQIIKDDILRKQISENAKNSFSEKYTAEYMCQQYYSIFNKINS